MGNQSTKDYKFAEKNKWRLWAWRQIKKRLWERGIRTRDAKGLYLAAESDKDRDVACRKNGFRPENLIAVEKEPATVKKLRAKKVVVIEGDVLEVLRNIGPEYLDFVNLDLCNSFTEKFQNEFKDMFLTKSLSIGFSIPVCVNLSAGRDKSWLTKLQKDINSKLGLHDRANRAEGVIRLLQSAATLSSHILKEETSFIELEDQMQPSYYSYKSTRHVWMDSVVFNMPLLFGHMNFDSSPDLCQRLLKIGAIKTPLTNLTKYTRAAKAIRTQRINGTKAPSPIK